MDPGGDGSGDGGCDPSDPSCGDPCWPFGCGDFGGGWYIPPPPIAPPAPPGGYGAGIDPFDPYGAPCGFDGPWENCQIAGVPIRLACRYETIDCELAPGDLRISKIVWVPRGGGSGGGAANNGLTISAAAPTLSPKKTGCGLAVAQGAISVGFDVLGAIPGLGNLVSASAAGARAVNGIVAYAGAAYGIATGLPDEAPYGAVSAGAGLGLTLADAALEGGKVIPVIGNALSATIGIYDGYQLAKTIQRCW